MGSSKGGKYCTCWFCQEYEAEFGPSEQSEGGDKEEAEVFVFYVPLKFSY